MVGQGSGSGDGPAIGGGQLFDGFFNHLVHVGDAPLLAKLLFPDDATQRSAFHHFEAVCIGQVLDDACRQIVRQGAYVPGNRAIRVEILLAHDGDAHALFTGGQGVGWRGQERRACDQQQERQKNSFQAHGFPPPDRCCGYWGLRMMSPTPIGAFSGSTSDRIFA